MVYEFAVLSWMARHLLTKHQTLPFAFRLPAMTAFRTSLLLMIRDGSDLDDPDEGTLGLRLALGEQQETALTAVIHALVA